MQLKVMIVDDSVIAVRKLVAMIESLGHRVVVTAASGAAAIDAYRSVQPDLVTMDITMPDMDGVEATRRLTGEFPQARIIMVTSHGQERMVIDALDAGAMGYVLKPVRPHKLAEMIDKVLTRSAPVGE
jgi:two-component system chemotaxis response regulator CheY